MDSLIKIKRMRLFTYSEVKKAFLESRLKDRNLARYLNLFIYKKQFFQGDWFIENILKGVFF